MKKQKIIEEVDWMLTDDTKNDDTLNPIDLDVLAILQFVANEKVPRYKKDGWFIIPLGKNEKIKSTSLQQYLEDFGVTASYRTVQRVVSKLKAKKYIDYKQGGWSNKTYSGRLSEIKILNGTIPDYHEIVEDIPNDSVSDNCVETVNNTKITDCDTESYRDIVISTYTHPYTNTDSYSKLKEKNKKEKDVLEDYFANKTIRCSWNSFVFSNPSVYNLGIPLDTIKDYFNTVKC